MVYSAPLPVTESGDIALIRPLLGLPKTRLIATLRAAKISFAEDPTNRDAHFTRVRLRDSMTALSREGLTAERLALLARRVLRSEIALYEVLNAAVRTLAPPPWPAKGPIMIDADAFAALPAEIRLRLLGRLITWTGDEGPVELGKLEALSDALADAAAPSSAGATGRLRRSLAGALVTLDRGRLVVERAPARRRPGKAVRRRIPALTTRKTGPAGGARTR
jgi:tRNA(Ile)-lysidine synthase